jgi:hypothetical protein
VAKSLGTTYTQNDYDPLAGPIRQSVGSDNGASEAPLVVLGARLVIDADAFQTADNNVEDSLRLICEKVHSYGDVPVRSRK